jgi:hypothetical protein
VFTPFKRPETWKGRTLGIERAGWNLFIYTLRFSLYMILNNILLHFVLNAGYINAVLVRSKRARYSEVMAAHEKLCGTASTIIHLEWQQASKKMYFLLI